MPQISVNDLKNGITLELDNGLFQVIEFQHVKPGKGGAFVRTKIRNLRNGAVIDKTFNAGIKVEQAIVDRQDMQFLYKDGGDYVFMNTSTYDQMNVPSSALGEAADYLTEQMVAQIAQYQGEIIGVEIAASVELRDRRDRAGCPGRPGLGCPQAGDARDRQGPAGAAVRRARRQGQGRHPHRRLPHPRLIRIGRTITMAAMPRPDDRSDARERALYLLYEAYSKGITPADALGVAGARAGCADHAVGRRCRRARRASSMRRSRHVPRGGPWRVCRCSISTSCASAHSSWRIVPMSRSQWRSTRRSSSPSGSRPTTAAVS